MIPIKDFLNKIRWDQRENPEDYTLHYHDRLTNRLIEVEYRQIHDLSGSFLVISRKGEQIHLPMHRIREVRKLGKVVWKRS